MSAKLTMRDTAVILDVHKYRYLTATQIEKLHFPSMQMAWRRLHVLTTLGFLKAFTTPNINERIFYLDKQGAEIVAGELHVEVQYLTPGKIPKDYYFLKHFLAINDFRILITKACQQSEINLLGFIPEYIGEKTKEGYVKKYIRDKVSDLMPSVNREYSHTPDAVFSLEKDGKPALFFLEIDRGSEIVGDPEKGFLKCIVFYQHYWSEKKWIRYNEDFEREFKTFRLLVVTTGNERLTHMREAVTRLPFPDSQVKRFLWGTIQGWLRVETVFDPLWQSMDATDLTPYKIG
jgi:Replication-relaxation